MFSTAKVIQAQQINLLIMKWLTAFGTTLVALPLSQAAPGWPGHGSHGGHGGCQPPQGEAGAAFALTNRASDNQVVAFSRDSSGKLTETGTYSTGGRGQGVDFDTSYGLTLSEDNKYLYAVSPADDKISVFEVNGSCLQRIQVIYGGDQPLSFAIRQGIAYALDGSVATTGIFGFHVGSDGTLAPITNETIPTSTPIGVPGSIIFTPDGQYVIVTNKVGSTIDAFPIDANGNAGSPITTKSAHQRPFSANFAKTGKLLIVDSGLPTFNNAGLSTYTVESSGKLSTITPFAGNQQTDGCWVVPTPDSKYAYTSNFISGTLSSFSLDANTEATLIAGVAANQGKNSNPVDLSMSSDGKYLYNLLRGFGSISAHEIQSDGSLKNIGVFGQGSALPFNNGASGLASF